jgi:cytochrome c556
MARLLASLLGALAFCMLASASIAASLASGDVDVKRRSERVKAAQELLRQFDKLASLIQSPRPSEAAWVQAEQAEIKRLANSEASTARAIQLLQTPEFQQQNVYAKVQEVRNALRCIIDSPPTAKREMFCWAAAAFLLDDRGVFYDGLLVLLRAKRLPDDLHVRAGAASLDGISLLYGLHAKAIQQYVVLPYLRGDIE